VGRSNRQAYAYFTVRANKTLNETAQKRLNAIQEFTEFGAGYRIAMRDLEIRGAGDVLGPEQSGHLSAVGYDMYVKLIEQAVGEARGEETIPELDTRVELHIDAYLPEDSILYPEVYADFVKNKETGKPYFSFVLNVQSHGPYSTAEYSGDVEYLTGDYSQECKNAMNNYMAAIMDGDRELMKLVENLRNDPEPVVLIHFSDHLPWMGDGNIYYDELGMDIDGGTEQGFRNHYTTDYLIWANDAAKEVLGSDFTGEGPTVSPCYLMNLAFEQMGWEGPAFMQAMEDMRAVFPVVTIHGCYVIDDTFVDDIPQERRELFDDFLYLQHYWRNEFMYGE